VIRAHLLIGGPRRTVDVGVQARALAAVVVDTAGALPDGEAIDVNLVKVPAVLLISAFFYSFFDSVNQALPGFEMGRVRWHSEFDFQDENIRNFQARWEATTSRFRQTNKDLEVP
jgi:hypothetical protein